MSLINNFTPFLWPKKRNCLAIFGYFVWSINVSKQKFSSLLSLPCSHEISFSVKHFSCSHLFFISFDVRLKERTKKKLYFIFNFLLFCFVLSLLWLFVEIAIVLKIHWFKQIIKPNWALEIIFTSATNKKHSNFIFLLYFLLLFLLIQWGKKRTKTGREQRTKKRQNHTT